MTVLTEGQHREEFLLRDLGDLSREEGTLTNGQNVVDGQVMKFSAGKLVAATGSHDSAGDSDEDIAGVIIGNWDVEADTPVPYIARLASVKAAKMTLHTGGVDAAKDAAVKAALGAVFVILR